MHRQKLHELWLRWKKKIQNLICNSMTASSNYWPFFTQKFCSIFLPSFWAYTQNMLLPFTYMAVLEHKLLGWLKRKNTDPPVFIVVICFISDIFVLIWILKDSVKTKKIMYSRSICHIWCICFFWQTFSACIFHQDGWPFDLYSHTIPTNPTHLMTKIKALRCFTSLLIIWLYEERMFFTRGLWT